MTRADAPAVIPVFADVEGAARCLGDLAVETPLLRADVLDQAVGAQVFVKAEALQRTGSFKFRGAYNCLARLTDVERKAGVVAFSSGNHAQGVAAAARRLHCPAVIVMPADAPAIKTEATRALGAEVVFYDRFSESREAISARIAEERGAIVVPSFDDPLIIAGQGTVGLEAARQLAALDLQADDLLCPVSGGGLLAGISLAFESLSPKTRLWSAEPKGFDDHARSLRARGSGSKTPIVNDPEARSFCDALLAPQPGRLTWPINERLLTGGVCVSDDEVAQAMAFAFRHLKLVLEPGGAVALASLLTKKIEPGLVVMVVASGGNVDPALFARAISPGTTAQAESTATAEARA